MASGLPMSAFDTMVVPDAEGWMEVSFVAPAEQFWMALSAEKLGSTTSTTAYIDDITLRKGWVQDRKCPKPGSIFAKKGKYRFGFNGAEAIDEIYGKAGGYDLGARMYNPRLGRMFSTDPREAEYAWQSTYAYYANSPINQVDFNGEGDDDEEPIYEGGDAETTYVYSMGKLENTPEFKSWYDEREGDAAYGSFIENLYNQKLEIANSGYAKHWLGVDGSGNANLWTSRENLRAQAEAEASGAYRDLYATQTSGIDPNSLNFKFNPIAKSGWYHQRALAVGSTGEGQALLSTVSVDIGFQYLGRLGFSKSSGPRSPMGNYHIGIQYNPIHGNSLKSLKPTWGYKLYSQDGTFLKNGITSKLIPEKRYTKSYMSDKYMEAIPFPTRLKAYQWEYQQNQILRGPLNLNMH